MIVLGAYLALLVQPYLPAENLIIITSEEAASLLPPAMQVVTCNIDKKANLSINLLLNALDRRFEVAHDFKVK